MSDDLSIPNPGFRGSRAGRYGTGPSRGGQMDPDTRRLMLFAGGLGAVLVTLIGASALIGHHSGEVPVIAADLNPIRVKPENPGGLKIDAAENDVFSGGSDTANSKLAPAAENPDIKALRTSESAPRPAVKAAPPVVAAVPPPVAKPVVVPPAVRVAPEKEKVAIAKPVPAVEARPAAAKSVPAVAEVHPAAVGAHTAMVQLAALTTEEAARAEWQLLAKRMPELLSGHQPSYSRTERDGHTFWRVRTNGFADVAQARTFCEHVRAKGGGCSVADF